MLTHGNLTAEVSMLSRVFALNEDEVLLSLLPLHHTFEFTCGMLLPLASGSKIVHPLGVDAANLSARWPRSRPTALIGVPALWQAIHRRIVDEVESRGPSSTPLSINCATSIAGSVRILGVNLGRCCSAPAHQALGGRLKLAVSGGAALPNRVAEFFNDLGLRLLEGYGLTEAAPVLSAARPDEPLTPGFGRQAAGGHRGQAAAPEPSDEVGEILARGPNVMGGYFRNQAATAEAL